MTNFVLDNFLDELNEKIMYLFAESKNSVNEVYDRFVTIFTETVDKFAPMRKATRKEKVKTQILDYMWLTEIDKNKNKMLHRLHKKSGEFELTGKYKTYRKVLNRLLKQLKMELLS